MKGQRRFVTVTRFDSFLGSSGDWAPFAVPVASVSSITPPDAGVRGSLAEARAKIYLKGDISYIYTKETMEELLQQIETPYAQGKDD